MSSVQETGRQTHGVKYLYYILEMFSYFNSEMFSQMFKGLFSLERKLTNRLAFSLHKQTLLFCHLEPPSSPAAEHERLYVVKLPATHKIFPSAACREFLDGHSLMSWIMGGGDVQQFKWLVGEFKHAYVQDSRAATVQIDLFLLPPWGMLLNGNIVIFAIDVDCWTPLAWRKNNLAKKEKKKVIQQKDLWFFFISFLLWFTWFWLMIRNYF